jgi:hypothetical protein
VKVNENAIKWVAEQTAGQAIAEGIAERDEGDAEALRERLSSTKKQLARYGRPELTGTAIKMLTILQKAAALDGARPQNEPKVSRAFAALKLLLHDAAAEPSTAKRPLRGAKGQRLARRGLRTLGQRRSIAEKRNGRRGSG